MRMRKKKNLPIRMERLSNIIVERPEDLKGIWQTTYPGYNNLHIELGCGKGRFTTQTAEANPDILFVAIERFQNALIIAMERAASIGLKNVVFMNMDVSLLHDAFSNMEVGRIYINFCDPWPAKRHAKRRLTSPLFLDSYKPLLKPNGDIHFKTDNQDLFRYSIEQFKQSGFDLSNVTEDLHDNGICGIMTDYEEKFYSEGKQICRLEAGQAGFIQRTGIAVGEEERV